MNEASTDLPIEEVSSSQPSSEPPPKAPSTEPQSTPPDAKQTPRQKALAAVLESFESKSPIEGTIIGWNKGGFHVSLAGIGAFCPRSQVELGNPRNPAVYMDKVFPFEILEMDELARRIVVSRKGLLSQEREGHRERLRKEMTPGAVLEGRVDSLSPFGAFVDLGGGIRGLIHVSELSRRRIENPEEAVSVGDEVKVQVLKVEKGGKRISLSRRALEPDPWDGIEERLQRGSTFEGKVIRHTDFGIFIEVEDGVEGLLHSSQLAIGSSASNEALAPGQTVTGWVREVDSARNRLSLTLREVPTGDPWDGIADRYEEGSVVEGQVEQSSRHGFFVALEPGLTGLLPFSAVTAPAGRRREDAYRPGQKIQVSIMELDKKRRRLSLGLEGDRAAGSKADIHTYGKTQSGSGLNAMAAAFEKLQQQ